MSSNNGKLPPTNDPQNPTDILVLFTYVAAGIMALGLFAILVYSLGDINSFLSVSMTAILVSAASLALGLLAGFIFGIPLTPKNEAPGNLQAAPENAEVEAVQPEKPAIPEIYRPNTSMEKISEWLATILVGIGLTQLLKLPGALEAFGNKLKPALGNTDAAPWVAIGALLLYAIIGFLIGFLWTRIKIPELYILSDMRQRLASAREIGRQDGIPVGVRQGIEFAAKTQAEAETLRETVKEPLPPGAAPVAMSPGYRVLWVDDQPENNQGLIQIISKKMNADFELCKTTDEALDKPADSYSLIISDMSRPGDQRAGINLLRELRRKSVHTPYLIYAGRVDAGLETEARRLGADGITASPIQLMKMVEKALRLILT
jgi:CheY-like chemotaxis protein